MTVAGACFTVASTCASLARAAEEAPDTLHHQAQRTHCIIKHSEHTPPSSTANPSKLRCSAISKGPYRSFPPQISFFSYKQEILCENRLIVVRKRWCIGAMVDFESGGFESRGSPQLDGRRKSGRLRQYRGCQTHREGPHAWAVLLLRVCEDDDRIQSDSPKCSCSNQGEIWCYSVPGLNV